MDKIAERALRKCKQLFPNKPLELHGYLRPDEVLSLSKLKEIHFHFEHYVPRSEVFVKSGEMRPSWVYFSINQKFLAVYEKYKYVKKGM